MRSSRSLLIAIVFPMLAAAAGLAQEPEPVDRAVLTALLLTTAEKAELDRLTGGARDRYVEQFWVQRDPSPGTDENELLTVLLRRAERANRMFADEPRPGWDTDRGHVLAVMGLPDEIERRTVDPGAPPPQIVWTYRRGSTPLEVVFEQRGGAYVLSAEVKMDAAAFYTSAQLDLRLLVAAGVGAVEGIAPTLPGKPPVVAGGTTGSTSSTVTTTPAAGPVPDTVAPEVAIWMQMIYAGVMRDELGVASRLDTIPAQQGTYTALSFEIDTEGLTYETRAQMAERTAPEKAPAATAAVPPVATTAPAVAKMPEMPKARLRLFGAYLQGEPGSEDTVHAFIIPFEVPLVEERLGEEPPPDPTEEEAAELKPEPKTAMRSAAVTLTPGTYRLAWGLLDEANNAARTFDQTVVIPDYTRTGLDLTRPLLVRPPHQQALREMTPDEVTRGFRMGNLILDARLDDTFARDEIIEVVLVASGWSFDPGQPGRASLEVEYRIVDAASGRALARLPAQSLDFSILGQQIPLGQVRAIEPGGSYRIDVRVRDLIGGEEATTSTPFRIAAAAAPETGSIP